MSRVVKRSLLVVILVAMVMGIAIYNAFGPGWTMHETADILLFDTKFGMRAQDRAIRYGDAILPLIVNESGDFERLNSRNAFWIAEVLGAIDTQRSTSIARGLYGRPTRLAHLVGAVALANRGYLDSKGVDDLIAIVSTGPEDEVELAIIGLGKAHAASAIPVLSQTLSFPAAYWRHAYACDAIGMIRSKEAISTLRSCLRSKTFYALPNAFRALITLGDREAVPLGIGRIEPEIKDKNSGFVVGELELVTGQHFGYNKQAWTEWWRSAESTWNIPNEFQKPYDKQRRVTAEMPGIGFIRN